MSSPSDLPSADVLHHIVDVHCHPTDAPSIDPASMQKLGITICAMSSMKSDQNKVKMLASAYPEKVIPCFGYHPWFSYYLSTTTPPFSKEEHYRSLFLSETKSTRTEEPSASESSNDGAREAEFVSLLPSLPEPRSLESMLSEVRENLLSFPNAMLGEVGLDRIFRVPVDYFASPRILTSFTIPLEHQVKLLEAQLDLAIELGRNVSMHSVKSQQATVELLARIKAKYGKKFYQVSVDMHSCGLSPQVWKDLEKKYDNVFLSLSTVINHRHANLRPLIVACSANRILVESDYNDVEMCTPQTWEIIKIIAEVKGWPIETSWNDEDEVEEQKWGAIRRLEKNWIRFKNGNHPWTEKKNKKNKRQDYDSDYSDI